MGANIHMYVEAKLGNQGLWKSLDKWSINPLHVSYPEKYKNRYTVDYDDLIYKERDYLVYAVLANVRNNFNIIPISEPKGLPNDVCENIRLESENNFKGEHSHSYLSLRELLMYNWNQEVSLATLEESEDNAIEKYGSSILFIEPYAERLRVVYQAVLSDEIPKFMEVMEKLKDYAQNNDLSYDNIRIVFWFDH